VASASLPWLRRPAIPFSALIGLLLIVAICATTVLAPLLAPADPTAASGMFLMPPGPGAWLGTDEIGRDIFSRMLYGGRVSLVVGVGAAIIATVIGVPLGLTAGYCGGRIDLAITQFANLFLALPSLVLALIVTAMIGPTLSNLVLVMGMVGWPRAARLMRGQALAIRETPYVEASRAVGSGGAWIVWRHILPNTRRIIAAQFSLTVASSIVTSASLSFLGLGIPPPAPDWGDMVRSGLPYLAMAPAMSLVPCCAVALTVLGFYLLGSWVK
jgi:peptide/nickel transport system permease protein